MVFPAEPDDFGQLACRVIAETVYGTTGPGRKAGFFQVLCKIAEACIMRKAAMPGDRPGRDHDHGRRRPEAGAAAGDVENFSAPRSVPKPGPPSPRNRAERQRDARCK